MGSVIVVKQLSTQDVMNIAMTSIIKSSTFLEDYLCGRFGLLPGEIVRICQEDPEPGFTAGSIFSFNVNESKKVWVLQAGFSYNLVGRGDEDESTEPRLSKGKGKAPLLTDLSDDSDDDEDVKVIDPRLVPVIPSRNLSRNGCPVLWSIYLQMKWLWICPRRKFWNSSVPIKRLHWWRQRTIF
jgi:hypothetical protein